MKEVPDLARSVSQSDLAELQAALARADAIQQRSPESSSGGDMSLLLWRRSHIKLQMYSEIAGHNRPHFHIAYKRQYSASYAIDTLERLCGYVPRRYEELAIEWARPRQAALRDIWNSLSFGNPLWAVELNEDE